ncbi:hypothetical protein TRFO_40946 [Tritrichomonas foetus]|uniref:Uncharacterized protein n=1 Tax=Tritrichomonas foetus TaxID=1144522 RepID=A0A1J4J3J5_9EUKA|nr:hypothetical protein TRFO_40946 [Tritrichomonas foetus]|eukprot:OHS92727.1 hypothetical protein TRFO_40946 [Tritrichomonas foetus]
MEDECLDIQEEDRAMAQENEILKLNNLLSIQIRINHQTSNELKTAQNKIAILKKRINELENINYQLITENSSLEKNIEETTQYDVLKKEHEKALQLIAELCLENRKLQKESEQQDEEYNK